MPSASLRLDLQTCTKVPALGPLTLSLKTNARPDGIVSPAFGVTGVMPFLVTAPAGAASRRSGRESDQGERSAHGRPTL